MQKTDLLCRLTGWVAVLVVMGACSSHCAHSAPLPVDNASLQKQMPGGIEYRLPDRVFPPDLVEKLRAEAVYRKFLYRSIPANAPKWTSIPLARWSELISDFAPVSIEGNTGNPRTMGNSPFTGKMFRGLAMTEEEFIQQPFQAREAGTDFIIYAREADMPADYPARPNHTEKIPHLDGTLHDYRFFVPEQYKDAGPEYMSDRKHWFCPAGEVWRARLKIIMASVIPDLTAAVLLQDNRDAVKTLAAVLDRLADVYPGLPVYGAAKGHGFARSPDRKGYMTAEQYRSIASRQPFIHARAREDYPFWYVDIYDFSFDKLHGGVSAWTDGVMDQMGWVAGAFDLIRDQPETLAFSTAKYGAADAWEKRFRERCLKELEFLALATPPTTGNTSYAYITGSVKAGIACQNPALFRKGLEIIEMYLYNNWSADGMAGDAAFNYAMMTQAGILGLSWLNTYYGGVDWGAIYPLKNTIDALGYEPVKTLLGINSKHADEHSYIFRHGGAAPDPAKLPYERHESSQTLPFYGLTTLRGGAPGRRAELIVNHQNAMQHAHRDRLSYQLFYQGIDCLPDFGYCIGYIEPEKKPWSEIKTGYELMGLPNEDTDRWGPWKWGYADLPETHGVLMVDHWFHNTAPCRLLGYAGAASAGEPGWWAQFADTEAASLFEGRPNPVDLYRRQLALLTLPGGSPLVLDVFRVRGGARHDLFWQVPGERPATMPPVAEEIKAEHWTAYTGRQISYDYLTGKAIQHYGRAGRLITDLQRYELPAVPWQSEWQIQPARTFPQPEAARANYGNWEKLLHDVRLGMWSYASGSAAQSQMVCGRGPWPGSLTANDPATGRPVTATVGLKDALDYRILTRQREQPGLESTFVHALETRSPDQPAELVELSLDAEQPLAAGGGVVGVLKLRDGSRGVFATTLNGETLQTSQVSLQGRMAAVFPQAARLTLVDGTTFGAEGWRLDLQPGWQAPLAGLEGDLTGQPHQSALIIQSTKPLPVDGTLQGRLVYVQHQCSPHLQSIYTIAAVAKLPDNRWRIELAGSPPFVTQRARVLKTDPQNPQQLEQDFQFHLLSGRTNVAGRRIRFLRSGFETALVETGRSQFSISEAPPAGAVAQGDAFVVYSIQAGDQVTIPSHFACTGEREPAGSLRLNLVSTGAATLELPGSYQRAEVISGGQTAPLKLETLPGGKTRLRLTAGHLHQGRAAVHLR
jgi:hypothetical protein